MRNSTSANSTFRRGATGTRYSLELRHEAIRRASAGEKPRTIAAELGITTTTIYKWCQRARLDGISIPDLRLVDKEERDAPKVVKLNVDLSVALEEERKKRGYPSISKFIHEVLGIMIEEPNLFDAVLDKDD